MVLFGSLAQFIFVLLESGAGYPFFSFPSESCINLFFVFLFCLPIVPLKLTKQRKQEKKKIKAKNQQGEVVDKQTGNKTNKHIKKN
jgi:hypothetical protein